MTFVPATLAGVVYRVSPGSDAGRALTDLGVFEAECPVPGPWGTLAEALRPGGHVVAVVADPEPIVAACVSLALRRAGLEFRDTLMWATEERIVPILLYRKRLVKGSMVANILDHAVGAIHVDGCRVPLQAGESLSVPQSDPTKRRGVVGTNLGITRASVENFQAAQRESIERTLALGRYPTNVLFAPESAVVLDEQSGTLVSGKMQPTHTTAGRAVYGQNAANGYVTMETYGDSGGASRFFPSLATWAEVRSWLVTLISQPDEPAAVIDEVEGRA